MAPLSADGTGWTTASVTSTSNDNDIPSKGLFQYVFGFKTEDAITNARDDTWHIMLNRMAEYKVSIRGRYPGQSAPGRQYLRIIESAILNDERMVERHFGRSLYQRNDQLSWQVPGVLPGDARPRPTNVKRTFIQHWLHYVWNMKKPKDNELEGTESETGVDAARSSTPMPTPDIPSKRKRHGSNTSANSGFSQQLRSIDLGDCDGGQEAVDNGDASRALAKSIPKTPRDATVWAASVEPRLLVEEASDETVIGLQYDPRS